MIVISPEGFLTELPSRKPVVNVRLQSISELLSYYGTLLLAKKSGGHAVLEAVRKFDHGDMQGGT